MGPAGDQCERANAPVANPSSTGISCIQTDFLEGKPVCDEALDMESIYAQVEIAATL